MLTGLCAWEWIILCGLLWLLLIEIRMRMILICLYMIEECPID